MGGTGRSRARRFTSSPCEKINQRKRASPHVQRPALRYRRIRLLGRPLSRAGKNAQGSADRVRAAARLDRLYPARRHLHPGKAHRRVLLAPAGRIDEYADGPQHDAQGRRCAHGRTHRDVSFRFAAHRARHLAQGVSGPRRPHPRRAGSAWPRRPLQGVRAAAVGRMPEGHHRADQHARPRTWMRGRRR